MTGGLEGAVRGARDAARAMAASGRPIVGIVGRDVPAVLVTAAGGHPFRIAPESEAAEAVAAADAVLGRAIDRAATLVLAAVLAGSLDFLAGILVSHDSEASVRLFYALQELHRRGRIAVPVRLVDQVHQDRESTLRFNVSQLAGMQQSVESWTSTPVTAASLRDAVDAHGAVRAELVRLRGLRGAATLSGTRALHAYRAAAALAPERTVPLLRELPDSAAAVPASALPVYLTGSAPLGDEVYRAIEAAGALVVGEDHDWGDPILSDRLPRADAQLGDPLLHDLAVARLRGAPASATSTMASRAAATRDGIEASGARALLSVVRHHDEAPAWDWRHQSARAGVPALLVRGDDADAPDRIAAAVETLRAAS